MEHSCHPCDNAHLQLCGAFDRFTLLCPPKGKFDFTAAAKSSSSSPHPLSGYKIKVPGRGISTFSVELSLGFFFDEGARYR